MSRDERYARERLALEAFRDRSYEEQAAYCGELLSDHAYLEAITGTDPTTCPSLIFQHRWQNLVRELLWTSDEINRTNHFLGLALFRDNLHGWKELFRALTWANYDLLFARRRRQEALEESAPEYRFFIASAWAGFARNTVHKIWLARIQILRSEWAIYWSRRPATRIGARATTRSEALTRFVQQNRFCRNL